MTIQLNESVGNTAQIINEDSSLQTDFQWPYTY